MFTVILRSDNFLVAGWLIDGANAGHADVERAVHFHRLEFGVARELESSVGQMEAVAVQK